MRFLYFSSNLMETLVFILCVLIQFVFGQDNNLPWRELYCPFTDYLIGRNHTELFHYEYVNAGEYLKVPCCQKFNINSTKQFYRRNRFFLDEETPLLRNYDELVWYIADIHKDQTGAYYCKEDFATLNEFTFVYYIDIDLPDPNPIRGRIDAFFSYKQVLNALSDHNKVSTDPALVSLRERTGLGLIVDMRWDAWTDCNFCTGEKTRLGRCHMLPVIIDEVSWNNCKGLCALYKNSLHMDCRSYWTVEKIFAASAQFAKEISNFQAVAKCVGPCISNIAAGYDYVKKLRTRILNVGESAVISCPGYTRKKNCYWRQNGEKLTSNEYDPFRKVSVNELCMLYLNYVTIAENGNFTCYLNDKMIQQNKVIVEILYSEQYEEWWRHVTYLLYVVFMCFIILVGGIAIGCLQKENFRKINTQEMIEMYATRRFEYERLLPPSE